MEIRVSQNIKDYVRDNGLAGIMINTYVSGCCCGAVEATSTKFISESKIPGLLSKGYKEYDVGGIKVMMAGNVVTEDIVDIRMNRFLGMKNIRVGGIKLVCGRTCRPSSV